MAWTVIEKATKGGRAKLVGARVSVNKNQVFVTVDAEIRTALGEYALALWGDGAQAGQVKLQKCDEGTKHSRHIVTPKNGTTGRLLLGSTFAHPIVAGRCQVEKVKDGYVLTLPKEE